MLIDLRKKRYGFTFIELMVSISIFMLISGMMLANFRAGDNSSELTRSAELLVSKLRESQTRALSGVGGLGVIGHGVYVVDGDTFFLPYTDTGTSDLEYDSGEESVSVQLLNNVEINTDADIAFAVPSGDVYESGVLQTSNVIITVLHISSGLHRDVTISFVSGQITIGDTY